MRTTKKPKHLPRSAGELEGLADYYDAHDTSADMEHGKWVDPRPMKTTSLRLPTEVVDALKNLAREQGVRYTTLVREIIERAVYRTQPVQGAELAQINERLARIEAALARHPDAGKPDKHT